MDLISLNFELLKSSPPEFKYKKWIIHMLTNWNNITDNEVNNFKNLIGIPRNYLVSIFKKNTIAITDNNYKKEIILNIFEKENRCYVKYI